MGAAVTAQQTFHFRNDDGSESGATFMGAQGSDQSIGTGTANKFRIRIIVEETAGGNANVYYGVHGLDDNTHLNPYADVTALCGSCSGDGDCPGVGNRCVRLAEGAVCGAECTTDAGCPDDYACMDVAVGSQITGKQCLPLSFTCK